MILVVDQDVSFLERAREILNRDRQVLLAFDAKQAFLLAERLGFSVALIDLDLNGQGGLALIEQLRSKFPQLSIIAISSILTAKDSEVARELGADEVLQKPITPDWKAIVERLREARRS